MKNLKELSNELIYGDIVKKLAELHTIGISEARVLLSEMSFSQYRALQQENITPPSGQTIGPSGPDNKATPAAPSGANIKAIWPGKGAPVEVGMTVGAKGANGMPVPGEVTSVDMGANGVKIKNPTTGQDEWRNIEELEPFMAQADQTGDNGQMQTTEKTDIARMRQLAGIKETCSSGATGAGAIATAPATLGGVKKRAPAEEGLKHEYKRKAAPKTIVGDTKPHQASGELSANLAATPGKKTAKRRNS
jgi:hypothetical protein